MKIDLHCHTSRHSDCGVNSPEEMVEAAIAAGLDGIALTEHDKCWPESELEELRRAYPSLLILGGIEISLPEGHLLIYGTRDLPDPLEECSLAEIMEYTADQHSFRAIAHPFRFDDSPRLFSLLAGTPLDGVEVVSGHTDEKASRMANQLADAAGLVRIACSDAHDTKRVGLYYTILEDPIRSEKDLVTALRRGRCRPCQDLIEISPVERG